MTELSDSLWVSYDESMPLPRGHAGSLYISRKWQSLWAA